MATHPSEPGGDATSVHAGAVLTIDLDAIAANYRILADRVGGATCAAVVKADAYGLGLDRVAPVLARAGCRTFFVAQLDEGIALRALLPEVAIVVLGAPVAGFEDVYRAHRLSPTLNQPGDIAAWRAFSASAVVPPAVLHVDTGMARLGLSPAEVEAVADDPTALRGIDIATVMSHLACADEAAHPLNRQQLENFRAALARLPLSAPASFANSSGIFLGADYHFDLARPGVALYGANPTPGTANPMQGVVTLTARVLQLRDVDRPLTVGYGATHHVTPPAKLATVAMGYADGYLRSASHSGRAWIDGVVVPIVGRVSMDLIVLDVSALPPGIVSPGDFVEMIGPHHGIDAVADAAGTIGYEILTSLGHRYHRRYVGGHD